VFVTLSIFLNFSKFSLPSAFVKMSAIFSLVEKCISWMVFGLYMMSNQMVLHVDVLGLIMESRILHHFDCKSVFNQKWSSIHMFLLQILYYLPEPQNLFYRLWNSHIFYLYSGIYWKKQFLWSPRDSHWSKTHEVS